MERSTTSEAPSPNQDGPPRKKMRKGTHSCFECRRRKIRCIFTSDNPNICTECFARGSQCIDQEAADPSVVVDQRKNLRERVARLETLLETLLEERETEKHASAHGLRSLARPSGDQGDDNPQMPTRSAPLLSLLDNEVWVRAPDESSGKKQAHSNDDRDSDSNEYAASYAQTNSMLIQRKNERVHSILMAALPAKAKLDRMLDANRTWWDLVTYLMRDPDAEGPPKTIHQFAAQAKQNVTEPTELAQTCLFVAQMSDDIEEVDRMLHLVETLILSDDEYMGTLAGVEVAVIQARIYSDIGQARRCWLTTRRAVNFATLMGLHRTRVNVRQDFIWWGLFQRDRFSSLLLGTPYALPDIWCNLTFKVDGPGSEKVDGKNFLTKLSVLAGKVIDRTHGMNDQDYSGLLVIDQDLTKLATAIGPDFWTENLWASSTRNSFSKCQTTVQRILFHQTRLVLHLPYMIKSLSKPGFEYSQGCCFDSARAIIADFIAMRHGHEAGIYRNKFTDFIAFMACVTLVMGLVSREQTGSSTSPSLPAHETAEAQQPQEDWNLVDSCVEIFLRISAEPFGKVSGQSYRALLQLTSFRTVSQGGDTKPIKVVIPFFGTITVQRGHSFAADLPHHSTSPDQRAYAMSANSQPTATAGPAYPSNMANLPSPLESSTRSSISSSYTHHHHQAAPASAAVRMQSMTPNPPPQTYNAPPFGAIPHHPGAPSIEPSIEYDGVYQQTSHHYTHGIPMAHPSAAGSSGSSSGVPHPSGGTGGGSSSNPMSGGILQLPQTHLPPTTGWQNVGTFDLDQDWNWLVQEMNQGGGHGGAHLGPGPQMASTRS